MSGSGRHSGTRHEDSSLLVENLEGLRPEDLFSLDGKVALVTGAAGGIGQWIAAGLGAAGGTIVSTDRTTASLEPVAAVLDAAGVSHHEIPADLATADATHRLVAQTVATAGALDVVVNCAALNSRMPALEVDTETYDSIMAISLRMAFFLSQEAARVMARTGGGSILHISSTAGSFGLQSTAVYGAAKAGLNDLTRTLAVEWAPIGVRVNCVAPGFMMTPLTTSLWDDDYKRQWMLDRVPLARAGKPRELVGMCVLLSSPAASFTTGQVFVVDGGFLAGNTWERPEDGA